MNKEQALQMINRQFESYLRLCKKPEYENDFKAQGSFYSICLSTADGMREAFHAVGIFTYEESCRIRSQFYAPSTCISVSLD